VGFSPKLSDALTGCGVWIPRPKALTQSLKEAIEIYGGTPLCYPTVEIQPIPFLKEAVSPDIWIVVSQHAALQAGPWRDKTVLAVGEATAQALRARKIRVSFVPDTPGSEPLVQQAPQLQAIQGKSIGILTGKGGRRGAWDTLVARGATVQVVECYERLLPPVFSNWEKWRSACCAIVVSSQEVLDNAYTCLQSEAGKTWLSGLTGVAVSPRLYDANRQRYPAQSFILADSPHDADVVAALIDWWEKR
jgi:uroporphyrinogen-III synthase